MPVNINGVITSRSASFISTGFCQKSMINVGEEACSDFHGHNDQNEGLNNEVGFANYKGNANTDSVGSCLHNCLCDENAIVDTCEVAKPKEISNRYCDKKKIHDTSTVESEGYLSNTGSLSVVPLDVDPEASGISEPCTIVISNDEYCDMNNFVKVHDVTKNEGYLSTTDSGLSLLY